MQNFLNSSFLSIQFSLFMINFINFSAHSCEINIHEMKEIFMGKNVKKAFLFRSYVLKFCIKSHKNRLKVKMHIKFHTLENTIKIRAEIFA